VRLKSLRLNRFGRFHEQEIELAPLTILFGANGAGKSTILDAIEDALTLFSDRMDIDDALALYDDRMNVEMLRPSTLGSAVVFATLDDRQIRGTSDERIMRHLLWKNLEHIDDTNPSWEDPFQDCPPLEDLMLRKTAEMIQSGTKGTPEARIRVAAHLLKHSVLAFGALNGESSEGEGGNWGLVCSASLNEIAHFADTFDLSALVGIENMFDVFFPDEEFDGEYQDELLQAVWALKQGDDAIVALESVDPEVERFERRNSPEVVSESLFSRVRLLPMRLEFEPATLDLELEVFVDQIASRLSLGGSFSNNMSWLTTSDTSDFAKNSRTEVLLNSVEDTELITQVQPETQSFIISSLIRSAVERIASHANSIAPKFLLLDSHIDIEIISPTEWKPNTPRLRTTMNENGTKFPLSLVGSGVARWASYSIRLACQDLLKGTIAGDPNLEAPPSLDDVSFDGATPNEDFRERIFYDGGTPYEKVSSLKILSTKLDVVLLLDEPEAHLHPRAVASIGEWLLEISPRVAAVVVATHHPSLFNLRGPVLQKHVVLRSQGISVIEPWNPASEELVAQLAHQIGLTAGELFMMSRFVLFVEGPHDLVILEEFYGDLLRGCMVRLVPLHGAHNISLLATSEIVWQMGIPIGVLTDGTNIERVMDGKRSNHVEKLVDRMLRECEAENREVAAFGLDLDDILFYLDDEITATFASEVFPGWSKAVAIWKQIDQPANDTANGAKFKKWITKNYGLALDRDTVRGIAKKCKEMGIVPEELSGKVSEIVSKTI